MLVGGVIVAVGMAVYGTGLVHFPDLDEVLKDVGSTLGAWTYLLVGVLCFLESGAFVGLLIPGETAIVVGGFVAGQGRDRHHPADRDRVGDGGRSATSSASCSAAGSGATSSSSTARASRSPRSGIEHVERFYDKPRRQGRLPRALGRPRARRLAVRRRLLGHAAAALPALRRARRRRDGDRLLPARLHLLALARQSPGDRQTRPARARHGDRRRGRADRRRRALAARSRTTAPARRVARRAASARPCSAR